MTLDKLWGFFCVAYYNLKGSTLDYGSINRGDGNWLDFGYILKLMRVGFAGIFYVNCVRQRKFMNAPKTWLVKMSEQCHLFKRKI